MKHFYPRATFVQATAKVLSMVTCQLNALLHAAQPYPDDEQLCAQLRAAQLRKIARLGVATLPSQWACAMGLAWMLYDLNPAYCMAWITMLTLVCAVAAWRMQRNINLKIASRRNLMMGSAVIIMAAILWGSLPLVMLNVAWEAEDIPILLAMVGIASGGAVVFQSIPLAAAAWVLIVGTCTIVGMWMDGFVHVVGITGGAFLLLSVLLRNIWATSAQFFASQLTTHEASRLAESLSQHALIVENTSNGVVLLDAKHKVTWINPGFARQSGYSPEDVVGRTPEAWLSAEDLALARSLLRTGLDERHQGQAEMRFRHRGGDWIWAHIDVKRLPGRQVGSTRYVLVTTDITKIKHAEQALRREQERQGHIIDGTHCGTWEMDMDGGVCMIGGHWFDLIGVDTRVPFVVEGDFLLGRIHPDDREGHLKALRRYVQGDGAQFAHEHRLRHEDGSWRWVSARGKAFVRGEDGRIRQMTGISVDISKTKAIEQALIDATRQAKQANHAKSLFLATMSHEIRTPMNGVIGTAEWLKVTRLDAEQREGIQTIVQSGRALLTIIDDILDFTKIDAGRMKLEVSAVSLLEMAEGVADAILPVAAGKHVDVHVFVDPRLPDRVMGDAIRLRQVLFNLVGNAVKFGAGTEGRLGQVDVQILMSEDDDSVWQMHVSDDGIGMGKETLNKLFTPFMQAEAATTRRFGGTGLGLAICHRLIELMGGGIVAHSVPGHGSTFIVTLPLMAHDEPLPESEQLANLTGVDCVVMPGKNYRPDSVAAYLAHAGAQVSVCHAQDEARDEVARSEMSVLITDTPAEVDQLALAKWGPNVRHLWFGRHLHGAVRIVAPNVGQLGRAHVCDILRAAAVLTGRQSPEQDRKDSGEFDVFRAELDEKTRLQDAQAHLILVAEDDPTNQNVVKRQLKMLGYPCEVAENGQLALERWRTGRFDILLSDLHMPVLDGYELAQQIRADEAEAGRRRIPILALTANALVGEQVRARECGMDDYLTKPIALRDLHAALKQWLPAHDTETSPLPQFHAHDAIDANDANDAKDHLDLAVLRSLVGDEEAMIRELLSEFAVSAHQMGLALEEARAAESVERIRQLAHQLKSAARSVGAGALGQLCETCEMASMRSADFSDQPLQDLLLELQVVLRHLNSLIQESTP
jgi:PAS domain S-box-containing protein